MRTTAALTLLALCLLSPNAQAGLWEEGYEAYQRKDYATAVTKWNVVANTGDREAQSLLGIMHFAGQGTPQSYPQAIVWLRRAAAQGEPKAQYKLGNMYANGQGFDRDYQKAAMWYVIADLSGHPEAGKSIKKAAAEISESDLVVARRWAQTCIKREFKSCE